MGKRRDSRTHAEYREVVYNRLVRGGMSEPAAQAAIAGCEADVRLAKRHRWSTRRTAKEVAARCGHLLQRATSRVRRAARPKAVVRIVGHNGDPTKLDDILPGSFLTVQKGGGHRVDTDVPAKRTAAQVAKSFMSVAPKGPQAFVTVTEVKPTGETLPVARYEAKVGKTGALSWGKAATPVRASPRPQHPSPPVGYVPWKKEQQALSFAPELRQVVPPVAPRPPRRVYATDARGQAMMFGANSARAHRHPRPPRWVPLRTGGALNAVLREHLAGKNGVYAIREKGSRTTLYVGESHSGALKSHAFGVSRGKKRRRTLKQVAPGTRQHVRHRLWKTLTRHVFVWRPSKRSRAYLDWAKRTDEFVYNGNHDLEAAVWTVPQRGDVSAAAKNLERALVLELEPIHNQGDYGSDESAEAAPF